MTDARPRQSRQRHRRRRTERRGSIYALVLGLSLLIAVVGMGALATARVASRASGTSNDWEEAGALAFSAVEHALARLNAEATADYQNWRNVYTSGAVAYTGSLGGRGGQIKWVLVDESDGVFNDDTSEPFRLYGVGVVGTTKRVYSVQISAGGDGLDVLRTAMHANVGIKLNGPAIVLGGPISTNGAIENGSNLVGGAGTEVAGSGSITTKPMPGGGVFEMYKAKATTIATSSVGSTWSPNTLSASSNPYGAANPDGIYYVQLSSGFTRLTINSCRLKGTLLIEGASGRSDQELEIRAPHIWEPSGPGFATLITRNLKTIVLNGSTAAYNDSGADKLSEVRGLVHTIGSSNVQLLDSAFLRGCLVADGVITTSGNVGATATPSLVTSPPLGYCKGSVLKPVPGTWKWDAPPSGT